MPTPKNTAPVDPNVKIPAAVKAGIARAEQLQAQFVKDNGGVPPEVAPAVEPIVAEATPPVVAPVATPPVVAPVEPQVTPPGNDDWENKYKAMKGRFDKSQSTMKEMGDQITSLQRVLATVKPDAQAEPAAAPKRLVTPEETSEFGAEFLDVVGRRAQEQFGPLVAELRGEIAGLKSQVTRVGGSVESDAISRLYSVIDAQVPNWREVNKAPEFLSWLGLPDHYSGVIRHELLKAAFERQDAPRVVAFFNGFLAEEAAVAPASRVPDEPPAAIAPPAGKVPLEAFAAPGRARSAAGEKTPAEKPIIPRAQITQFYIDAVAGKYRGREDVYKQNELAIFAAQAEGRIR